MSNIIKNVIFVIALIILSNVNSSNGLRILGVFPMPMNSMNVICEELMTGLAERGHQVDVYSHFPPKKPIPNFTHFNLLGSLPAMTNNISFTMLTSVSFAESLRLWVQAWGKEQCELLEHPHFQKLIKNPPKDPSYDLVVLELTMAYCFFPLGRHLNVPIIFVENSPLPPWHFDPFGTPINLAVDPVLHLSYVSPMSFFERVNNFLSHHHLVYTFNYHIKEQDYYVEKYFGSGYPSVVDLQKDVSLVLINHDPVLYGIRPFSPNIIPISGLHVVDRNETLPNVVKKWLDDSKDGFIYFSFGSMLRIETFPRHILEAFYKSFEAIKPVRVLMKIAKPEILPPDLPSNVMTQPWLSQIQVLKHKNIKAFITHGGMMGTQEAIYYGVPMVGVPVYFDQHLNIKSYVKRKIAIKLLYDEITDEIFTNALEEILNNSTYKKNVIKIRDQSRDRPMSPMDTAAFWIEYIHRHGKDALRSPIVDMPRWQASLLDVYAFILGSILTVLLIIFVTIKKLINLFKPKADQKVALKKKKS